MAHETYTYYGEISGGVDLPDDPAYLAEIRKALDGQRVTWTVEKWRRTRTTKQNRAWFGVVITHFCKLLGMRDKKEVHRIVLRAIGHYDVVVINGREIEILKTTHNLPTDEFGDLYAAAQQLAAEWFGYAIPDPDPEFRKKAT
jgi:hypothetical protein